MSNNNNECADMATTLWAYDSAAEDFTQEILNYLKYIACEHPEDLAKIASEFRQQLYPEHGDRDTCDNILARNRKILDSDPMEESRNNLFEAVPSESKLFAGYPSLLVGKNVVLYCDNV